MAEAKKPVGGGALIFKPIDIDIERLFVAPEKNDTTKIAALLAKCLVPFRIGVLDVPEKILHEIEEMSKNSETIMPLEAIEVYKMIWLLNNKMISPGPQTDVDNAIDIFIHDAVKSAQQLIAKFQEAIRKFCSEIQTIQNQVASEKSFYMAKTLDAEIGVDPTLIITAAQNFIQSLNVIASGLKGYFILALVKTIDTVGKILDDSQIQQLHGVMNQTALVNKLGYRILPSHVAVHKQMSELIDLTMEIQNDFELEKSELVRIFMLSDSINKSLDTFVNSDRPAQVETTETARLTGPTQRALPEKKKPLIELIGKNVLLGHPLESDPNRSGIGHVVEILPANSAISNDKLKRYYGDEADAKIDSYKVFNKPRVVIQKESGAYIVVPDDDKFERGVTVI